MIVDLEKGFMKVQEDLMNNMEFERDDFTVVLQPALNMDDRAPLNVCCFISF